MLKGCDEGQLAASSFSLPPVALCPDLLVDGEFVEYESYTTAQSKNAFRNMFNDGLAQSDRIIIRECNLTDSYMKQRIQGKIQNGIPITTVWTFNGKEIRQLYNTEG